MNRGRRSANSAGFSLIELLLVVAIIAVLTSLYLNAVSGGARKKQQKVCQTNLQKLFIAMEIFAADHQESFPDVPTAKTSGEALDGLVPKYTVDTDLFICPSSKDSLPPAGESIAKRKISYAYYMGRKRGTTDALMTDQQVDTLSKTPGQLVFSASGDAPGNNHGKTGGNLLFGDGHVDVSPARLPFSLVFTQGVVLLNP